MNASHPARPDAHVAILMCTYNGLPHVTEQLDSFAAQTSVQWSAWVSDDGSSDGTRDVLHRYQQSWGDDRLFVRKGPCRGFAANFLSLVCDTGIDADYFAYSDQDDIWEPEKLAAAVSKISGVPAGVPALYCGRTRLVDAHNNEIGLSSAFSKPPGFGNALFQNIGGGNTMVFNRAARDLLAEAGADVNVVAHDWWTYMVVTGCGGQVFYDHVPHMRYRQHGANIYGTNLGLAGKLRRVRLLLNGEFKRWIDGNLTALDTIRHRLTPENRAMLDAFRRARQRAFPIRTVAILSSGARRQTALGTLGIIVASLVNRI